MRSQLPLLVERKGRFNGVDCRKRLEEDFVCATQSQWAVKLIPPLAAVAGKDGLRSAGVPFGGGLCCCALRAWKALSGRMQALASCGATMVLHWWLGWPHFGRGCFIIGAWLLIANQPERQKGQRMVLPGGIQPIVGRGGLGVWAGPVAPARQDQPKTIVLGKTQLVSEPGNKSN